MLIYHRLDGFDEKKGTVKNRVDYLYYQENMTQKEVGEILGISRQRVSVILNLNAKLF